MWFSRGWRLDNHDTIAINPVMLLFTLLFQLICCIDIPISFMQHSSRLVALAKLAASFSFNLIIKQVETQYMSTTLSHHIINFVLIGLPCESLETPSNGSQTVTSLIIGGVSSFSCDGGYRLTGSEMRTCNVIEGEMKWSGVEARCICK